MGMHEDQLDLTEALAMDLVRSVIDIPAGTRCELLEGAGTTSHVLRIGDELLARFPLLASDPEAALTAQISEHAAMAEFRAVCPVPSPRPVVIGEPSQQYPMPFSVQTWIEGELATPDSAPDSAGLAEDLAGLIDALREAPVQGRRFQGPGRGGDLSAEDPWVQECLDRSTGLLPVQELRSLWSGLRDLPRESADVMSHKDLVPANLLLRDGRLCGVLDTGGFGPADPALDLVAGWHLLDRDPRRLLQEQLASSELDILRGAGWAFAQAIGLVWYYVESNPMMRDLGRSTLARLLADLDTSAP